MQAALHDARLAADAIDYINLHGTATPANDATEALAVAALFGSPVACSSTKGATGHALGAAGAIEAVICRARAASAVLSRAVPARGRSMRRCCPAIGCIPNARRCGTC